MTLQERIDQTFAEQARLDFHRGRPVAATVVTMPTVHVDAEPAPPTILDAPDPEVARRMKYRSHCEECGRSFTGPGPQHASASLARHRLAHERRRGRG